MENNIYQIIDGLKQDWPDKAKNDENVATDLSPIVFYCKQCQKMFEGNELKNRKNCPECKESLVHGTKRSIENHFHFAKEFKSTEED